MVETRTSFTGIYLSHNLSLFEYLTDDGTEKGAPVLDIAATDGGEQCTVTLDPDTVHSLRLALQAFERKHR